MTELTTLSDRWVRAPWHARQQYRTQLDRQRRPVDAPIGRPDATHALDPAYADVTFSDAEKLTGNREYRKYQRGTRGPLDDREYAAFRAYKRDISTRRRDAARARPAVEEPCGDCQDGYPCTPCLTSAYAPDRSET